MPTFGDLTAGPDTFPCSDGRALVDRFTLTEAATVTGIYVNFDSSTTAGTNFKGIILADASGVPGSVLVVGTGTAVPAGGGYIRSPASDSLSAGDYWVGYVADSFQANSTQDATGASPDMQMANGSFDYASPPATWPGSDATYGGQINAYVEYTVAGGAVGTLVGVGGTASAGTTPATGAALHAMTGVGAVFGVGAITGGGAATHSITGADVIASPGVISGAGQAHAAITGEQAASSAGVMAGTAGAVGSLTGVSATATAGQVGASGDVDSGTGDAYVVGVEAIASAGLLAGTGSTTVTGTIYFGNGSSGSVWMPADEHGAATIKGVAAKSGAGVMKVSGGASASLVGIAAEIDEGDVEGIGMSRVFARENVSRIGIRGLALSMNTRKRGSTRRAEKLMRTNSGNK